MNGKKEKSGGLGRALVRNHNQLVQQSKDKSRALRLQQRRVLQSVTEISDIDAILDQADEAARVYSTGNPLPSVLLMDGDESSAVTEVTLEERMQQRMEEEDLYAGSLRVPRRPPWNAGMSVEELDQSEKEAFLVWRRSLARLEENEKLVLTPFEKNLDIWRQLWRVLERSDLLVMVVDARDPLFYRCLDLEEYACEIDEHKRTMLLVNKADLLPFTVRQRWANYFHAHGILYVFWSAKAASAVLEGKKLSNLWEGEKLATNSDADTQIYGREELLTRLQAEAEAIVASRRNSSGKEASQGNTSYSGAQNPESKQVVVGFVGYPNVGKSSTINALVGEKRTGVTSTPGKTKHFQTLIISEKLVLCDCPGLVFPSFSSSRHEMVACGVLPIDRLTEQREAVQVVANRVPRHALESIYNITLPKPKSYEPQSRPPWAAELLRSYCSSRGHVSTSGLPDETRATRQILKDYINGKLPHFELPPGTGKADAEANMREALTDSSCSDGNESDTLEDSEGETFPNPVATGLGRPALEHALDDLKAFDLADGLTKKAAAVRKKNTTSHKHHKKPQRKKDRSWRVGSDNGDGMPLVKVFQKPAVNFEALKASG